MKRNVNYKRVFTLIAICTVVFSSCGAPLQNVPVPADFKVNKGKIGIICVSTYTRPDPKANFHIQGNYGLLDYAIIKSANKELYARLDQVLITSLVEKYYLKAFSEAYKMEGFHTITVDTVYDHKALKLLEKKLIKESKFYFFNSAKYDFKPIFEELQTDYLLVLEIYNFGTTRPYYGFSPKGPPQGWTALRGSLIERQSNEVIAQQFAKCLEDSKGEWDEPPEYPNLMKAVSTSFEKAVDEVYISFLGHSTSEHPIDEHEKLPQDSERLKAEKQKLAYIPKTVIVAKVSLRSDPKLVSERYIKDLLKLHDFYDRDLNMYGSFANNFVDNGDGTVTDKATGLMWQKSGSSRSVTWRKAELYIDELNRNQFAGYSDWRLPTIDELASLLEKSKKDGLHIDSVFDRNQRRCWSSDSRPDPLYGSMGLFVTWIGNFSNGRIIEAKWGDRTAANDITQLYEILPESYVRLVRSLRR